MKGLGFTIFLLLFCFLNLQAQDSEQISQLTPIHKPTKNELKKIEKLVKKSGWKDIVCVLRPDDEFLEVLLGIENKTLSNGKKVSLMKATLSGKSLFFKEIEKGESLASTNVFIRISSIDEKVDGRFEETVNFALTKEQKDKIENLPYQKIFELPEGKYKLQFLVRDTQTGITGYRSINFEVN